MWNWSNYLHSKVPSAKKPLHVNLDESSIKLDHDVRHGLLTGAAKKLAKRCNLRRQVPKAVSRTAYSLVAVICDDAEIQKTLPQFIVVNKKLCTEAIYRTLLPKLPANMRFWRRSSSWLDIECVCKVIKEIAKALGDRRNTHQVILSMDACKTHMNRQVWMTAARMGFMMFGIPAKVTAYLQPLDVYAFAQLKNKLRRASQILCIQTGASYTSLGVSILALSDAISEVLLGKSWQLAFERLGHSGHQTSLSEQLLANLQLDHTPLVAGGFPSLADLTLCFPQRYEIDIDAVFAGVLRVSNDLPRVHGLALLRRLGAAPVVASDSVDVPLGSSLPESTAAASSVVGSPSACRSALPPLRRLASGAVLQPLATMVPPPPLPPPAHHSPARPPKRTPSCLKTFSGASRS